MIDGFQSFGTRGVNSPAIGQAAGQAQGQGGANAAGLGAGSACCCIGSGFGFGGGGQFGIPGVPPVPRANGSVGSDYGQFAPVNYNSNFGNGFNLNGGFIPQGSTGFANQGVASNGSPNVVVIDQTSNARSGIDLDGDGVKDRAHGAIVNDIIKSQIPNANISNVEIPNYEPATLANLFNGVSQRVDRGERVDAVNFSQQTFNDIRELGQVTGLPVNQQNIGQYKDQIRDRLFSLAQNPGQFNGDRAMLEKFTKWVPTIQAMDNLAAKGVPVYVAAGNDGANQVNMFALAKNANVVGATNGNGQITNYTANNTLINRTQLGNNPITAAFNGAGQVTGVDVTGDRRVDVGSNTLSGGGRVFDPNRELSGTSFATPRALVDGLLGGRQFA
jgi:hypothetical protein